MEIDEIYSGIISWLDCLRCGLRADCVATFTSFPPVSSLGLRTVRRLGRWEHTGGIEQASASAFSFFVCAEDLHTIGEIAWLAVGEKRNLCSFIHHYDCSTCRPLRDLYEFVTEYFDTRSRGMASCICL